MEAKVRVMLGYELQDVGMDFPLDPLEEMLLCQHLGFSSVRPTSDC